MSAGLVRGTPINLSSRPIREESSSRTIVATSVRFTTHGANGFLDGEKHSRMAASLSWIMARSPPLLRRRFKRSSQPPHRHSPVRLTTGSRGAAVRGCSGDRDSVAKRGRERGEDG